MRPKNTFVVDLPVSVPNVERRSLFRWMNIQFTGKETMSLGIKCSKEHQDAFYDLCRGRVIRLTIRVDKDGNWELIKSKIL
jgi:hypothetical protein